MLLKHAAHPRASIIKSTCVHGHHTAHVQKKTCVCSGMKAPTTILPTEGLLAHVQAYPEAYLLIGYSEKALFESVEGAADALRPHLKAAKKRCGGKPFLLVYGGDPASVPTIGAVVKQLQQAYRCHVLALQSWDGEHESWVDSVYMSVQHETSTKVVQGKEIQVQKQLWGGTRSGVPVGASRFYLSPGFLGWPAENVPGAISCTFFLGGGGISAEELQFIDEYGAPWVYIPCRAKNVDAYGSRFGPVHEYVVKKLAAGEGRQLAVTGNTSTRG